MGGTTKSLVNFTSMAASNLSEFLIFGEVDCHLFPIPGLLISSAGGVVLVPLIPMGILVPVLSLESGVEAFLIKL